MESQASTNGIRVQVQLFKPFGRSTIRSLSRDMAAMRRFYERELSPNGIEYRVGDNTLALASDRYKNFDRLSPDDLRHLGRRRGVAAALGADDAVDDGHADAG
jgi:hypothetical protein